MIEAAIPVAGMSILAAIALLSAMVFAASEFSIAKLTHAAVEDLIEDDKKNARALFKLVDQRRLVIFVLRAYAPSCRLFLPFQWRQLLCIFHTTGGWEGWSRSSL